MQIRIYNNVHIHCPNRTMGNVLVHLFRGCFDHCCGNSTYYYTITPTDLNVNGSKDSETTGCDSNNVIIPPPTVSPLTTEQVNSTIQTLTVQPTTDETISESEPVNVTENHATRSQNKSIAITVSAPLIVLVIIILVAVLFSCIVFICKRHHLKISSQVSSGECISARAKENNCICSTNLESNGANIESTVYISDQSDSVCGQFLHDTIIVADGSQSDLSSLTNKCEESRVDSSHTSTPTSEESSEMILQMHSVTRPRALVIYSPSTPEEKQELIRGHLLSQLHSYGIETLSHDLTCIKESPSLWLEREIAMATVVICVCNNEFKHDWECERNGTSSLPIVQSLNHLIYASINQNKDMSKYAVVLLEEGDKDCVPTMYLQSHSRQFMVYDVDKIVRFVYNTPTHTRLHD